MQPGAASLQALESEPRVQGVKYLNAWPPLYGLMTGFCSRADPRASTREPERLRMALPSVLARRLVAREADVALAPVATLALGSFELVRDICIGADGAVASVLIVGDVPLEDMDRLLLDTSSGTSVVLAQLVAAHLRNDRALTVESADPARIAQTVAGRTGAVIIGDDALRLRNRYAYVLDLGAAWKAWTGLPFVFAAWIGQVGSVDDKLSSMLRDSLAHGLHARREISHLWAAQEGGEPAFFEHYLTHNVRYTLDASFEAGLSEFFARAARAKLLPQVTLRFANG
jgi:chorismate dehydratase